MQEAVWLSNTAVLGNGLAQFAVNWRARHPSCASRPMIDWDAVLMLLPAQLGGGYIGVIVQVRPSDDDDDDDDDWGGKPATRKKRPRRRIEPESDDDDDDDGEEEIMSEGHV